MTCTGYESALSELVDGTLTRERRVQVEAHVESCADCQALLADLRRLRDRARSLPKLAPPPALWEKVRAEFEAERQTGGHPAQARNLTLTAAADPTGSRGGTDSSRQAASLPHRPPKIRAFVPRRRHLLAGLAAAAVLVLAASAGLYYAMRPAEPAKVESAAAHATPAESVQSIETELNLAVQHYQNAIAGLEKVASEGQTVLDPQTAAVLAKSQTLLDQAVTESQAALRTQPTSEAARASLFEALQRKVTLLRDTVSLINEMRKGDAAGTARVAGSIGKS